VSIEPEPTKIKAYDRVIAYVFQKIYQAAPSGSDILEFTKRDIEGAISELGLRLRTRNVPDIIYTYRSGRSELPEAILQYGNWAIEGQGKGKYRFRKLSRSPYFDIPSDVEITGIPDATPLIVLQYQGSDEQTFLARVRYNRLLDIFTSLTTYHLQSHFRTTVRGIGQVEVDDLYIGLDTDGKAYILPVEAKVGLREQLGVIQIAQMVQFTRRSFPDLATRPVGIKMMLDGSYLFLEFNDAENADSLATKRYKRYKLIRES
jgi:hypothetical protein